MFRDLQRDIVTLITQDGQEFKGIKANVQSEMIFIHDVSLPIQEGDTIIRELPNDQVEEYLVLDRGYKKGLRNIKPHYQIKVRKKTAIKDESPINQYIGTLVQGNISGSNILSIGLSNSQVSQIINDPAILQSEVETLLEKILEEVKPELKGDNLIQYVQAVDELKKYILTQEKSDPSILKKIIGTVSFLGSVDGTIGLTEKVWPYVYPLLTIAVALNK